MELIVIVDMRDQILDWPPKFVSKMAEIDLNFLPLVYDILKRCVCPTYLYNLYDLPGAV